MQEIKATVFFNKFPAGELTKNSSGYVFQYMESFLNDSKFPAISLSFPKQAEPFHSKYLFPFFFGLLSEGENKDIICRVYKIDQNDYFTLLLESANYDTIGPITVWPNDKDWRRIKIS